MFLNSKHRLSVQKTTLLKKGENPNGNSEIQENLIRDKIEQLPLKFKEVIILRDLEQCSYEEICDILKIPIGTVKSRINRGRLKLQKELIIPVRDFSVRPSVRTRNLSLLVPLQEVARACCWTL